MTRRGNTRSPLPRLLSVSKFAEAVYVLHVFEKKSQKIAAKALGVSQPRISDLVRGKVDKFSADMLIEMLGRAGVEVTITTKTRRRVA